MPLEPLDVVAEDQLNAMAGAGARRFEVGGCVILAGDDAQVLVVDPGDSQSRSCVWNSVKFRLRNDGIPFPEGAYGPAYKGLPIRLFARIDGALLHLGSLRQVLCLSTNFTQKKYELMEVDLEITPPLTRAVLDRVRPAGPSPELLDLGWLDTLERDRAGALDQFITGWYGPADPAAGPPPEIPAGVPAGLAALYRLAHGRPYRRRHPVVLGVHNEISRPERLGPANSDGRLLFGGENQGCFSWLLDASGDDPAVWTAGDIDKGVELEPLSGFLIQFSLFEAVMAAGYSARMLGRPSEGVRGVTDLLREVPLQPARWYGQDMGFHVAPGLVAWSDGEVDGMRNIWIGAQHRAALQPLRDLDVSWDAFDG